MAGKAYAFGMGVDGRITIEYWDENVLGPKPVSYEAALQHLQATKTHETERERAACDAAITNDTLPNTRRVQAILQDEEACANFLVLLGLNPTPIA